MNIQLTFKSKLQCSKDTLWNWITKGENINAELAPIIKMTNLESLDLKGEFQLGVPILSSWLLLFGIVPIGRLSITLVKIDREEKFLEESPMLFMKKWRHERKIVTDENGSNIIDILSFDPLFFHYFTEFFVKKIFEHRHKKLKREFNLDNFKEA